VRLSPRGNEELLKRNDLSKAGIEVELLNVTIGMCLNVDLI
jgi:hypothetical protein